MTGPSSAAVSSKGTIRPWCIEAVQWAAAEIYSTTTNLLTPRQVDLLKLFRPDPPVAVLP
jgi:hypothetical protein